MATKRLKDILETRKTSRETYGPSSGAGIQALLKAIEHELEVTVIVHEVRCEYEHQKEERLKMAKGVAELKDEANLSKQSPLRKLSPFQPCDHSKDSSMIEDEDRLRG